MKNAVYLKEFTKYTSLNIIAMLSLSCYILADTFFISIGIGAYGLASLGFAMPIFGIVFGCGLMLGIGGATKYTILRSQNDVEGANRIFTNTMLLMLGFAGFFVICGVFFAAAVTSVFGAGGEVFYMTKIYLQVILIFSPIFMATSVLVCFVRNDGAPRLAMIVMVVNSFMNIWLDYIFIIQQEMGMFGAALATGLANLLGFAILSCYFIMGRNAFHLIYCKITMADSLGVFAAGLPSLVTEISISVVIVVFNTIIFGLSGNIGVAAFGVIANILVVIISIYNGIAQGIQPLVSKYYGYGDTVKAKLILRYALVLMAGLSAAIYFAIFFGAHQIAGIFNSEQNELLQMLAVTGMRIYFTGGIFAGFNIIISIYFTSTENPRPAHIISMLRGFIVILPLVFMLSAIGGITGVWLTFPAAESIVCVIGCVLYLRSNQHN